MHDGTEMQTKKWTTTWSWSRYFSVEAVLATVSFMGSFKLNCSSTERPKLTQDHRWIDKRSDEKNRGTANEMLDFPEVQKRGTTIWSWRRCIMVRSCRSLVAFMVSY